MAKVIADSITPQGNRLTTLEVVMHRFVLAEFNTHRMFSRNSASSRAIPLSKQLDRLADGPATPVAWPAEQPGMQGGSELDRYNKDDAQWLWQNIFAYTWESIDLYLKQHPDAETRVHKSVINRLLEPFMFQTVVVTATEWQGFFDQRCSPLAQPEIRVVADAMREAMSESTPVTRTLTDGMKLDRADWRGWHLPYVNDHDLLDCKSAGEDPRYVSAARCARVSYLTHDGKRDVQEDASLFIKLRDAEPPHWSPLEHVARPTEENAYSGANFRGWTQLRTLVKGNA